MTTLGFILTILFIAFKLCEVIAWSWAWVTAPLWIAVIIDIALIFIVGVFGIRLSKWAGRKAGE